MASTLVGLKDNDIKVHRLHTAWMDNIETCTGLTVEESVRITEDRDKWRKYVHGVANPRIEDGQRTEQNSLDTTRFDGPR